MRYVPKHTNQNYLEQLFILEKVADHLLGRNLFRNFTRLFLGKNQRCAVQ